ncbi:Potassium transporter 5 [Forsythia ovata]|uniref:Potassium transporter n=1 Tax=Forsythia ovata TaxID=205694 RepID=A0ABD1WLQ3_9LAMI
MGDNNAKDDVENGGGFGLWTEQVEEAVSDVDRTMSFTRTYQQPPRHKVEEYPAMQTLLLAYQSLGVVYGDLGTSPVNVFSSTRLTNLTEEDLLGTLSLIIWTLTSLVLIKYVFIVLDANDHGEGGTFALYSYICRHINIRSKFSIRNTRLESDEDMTYYSRGSPLRTRTRKFLETNPTAQNFLTILVLLGTCMVIGDGALTPATCVLSALQGIQSRSSKITQDHVVWISVVLLVALFAFQHCGTSKVGFSFSPIMLLWFVTNVSIGTYNIIKYHPSILKAVSPHYIVKFFSRNTKTAWDLLGAVFLSITGAEAMFADLGHFNKRAIQLGFSFVVYPALILTYAGETAYLVKHPEKISDAYYSSLPDPVYWPMFVISTLAAVVASQSMISASFSIVKQSLTLGCFPRVNIIHTSSKHEGQVYSPEINYFLMILTVGLVVGFKGGVELANAYGVVVIWVMIITTFLTTLVMLVIWKTNILLVLGFFLPYMLIESIFMTSLLNKIPQGGWVPFAISAFFLIIMLSWTYGRSKKSAYEAERKMSTRELDEMLSSSNVYRTPGICFFFTDLVNGIPPIIRHYIQNTNSVRETMVIITVRTLPIKTVLPEERFNVGKLGLAGVYRCLVQFGYKDSQDMKEDAYVNSVMAKLQEHVDNMNEKQRIQSAAQKGIVFVIGRTILKANQGNGMLARFTIDYLYRFLQKNSRAAVSTLEIPPERTLQIGMLYEI